MLSRSETAGIKPEPSPPVTTTSSPQTPPAGRLPLPPVSPSQGHSPGARKVRDALDPAPHHTASDIRVLEILKRIRDKGDVDDGFLGPPPLKRKPGRTKGAYKLSPSPHKPESPAHKVVQYHPPVRPAPTTAAIALLTQSRLAAPTPSLPALIQPKNGAQMLTHGAPTTATILPSNQQKQPTIQMPQQQQQQQQQQQLLAQRAPPKPAIGLELILPNGVRIPVAATATTAAQATHCAQTNKQATASSIQTSPPPMQASPHIPSTIAVQIAKPASSSATVLVSSAGGGGGGTAVSSNASAASPSSVSSSSATSNATAAAAAAIATAAQNCACSRSKCLKLYCDCFASGRPCGKGCNCRHCYNSDENDATTKTVRDSAVKSALSRNPLAFKSKIEEMSGKHVLGCRCKRSRCLKGYCECYLAKIPCNQRCRCLGCSNENSPNAKKTDQQQLPSFTPTWLANLATRSHLTAVANGNAATASPSTFVTTTNSSTSTNTASNETATSAVPRTITLTLPMKALSGSTTPASATVTTATVPPAALQSLLNVAAAAAGGGGTTTAAAALIEHPEILKYLRSVLPSSSTAQNSAQVAPTPPVNNVNNDISSALHALLIKQEAPLSRSNEDASRMVGTAAAVSMTTDEGHGMRDVAADNDEDFAFYTEEELAFMQRLRDDRKHDTPTTMDIDASVNDTMAVGGEPSENDPAADDDRSPFSLDADTHDHNIDLFGNHRWTRPRSAPSVSFNFGQPTSTGLFEGEEDRLYSLSGPASLGGTAPSNNNTNFSSNVGMCFHHARVDDVLPLRQKIEALENQVAKLMRVVRAQGGAIRSLAAKVKRPPQQGCCYQQTSQ